MHRANKYHEDLTELHTELQNTENWTAERTHLVYLCCEIMGNKNISDGVRERAYHLVLQFGSAANAIAQYNTDKMKDSLPVQLIGHSK
mgnify:FL=1